LEKGGESNETRRGKKTRFKSQEVAKVGGKGMNLIARLGGEEGEKLLIHKGKELFIFSKGSVRYLSKEGKKEGSIIGGGREIFICGEEEKKANLPGNKKSREGLSPSSETEGKGKLYISCSRGGRLEVLLKVR